MFRRRLEATREEAAAYLAQLNANGAPREVVMLAQELTGAETYFFRHVLTRSPVCRGSRECGVGWLCIRGRTVLTRNYGFVEVPRTVLSEISDAENSPPSCCDCGQRPLRICERDNRAYE